jgi:MGT family glycosyltransferase
MKRTHVAIFTLPGNGHVYPTLGICSELVNRGYRVTYATTEGFAGKIRETGAQPVIFQHSGAMEELEEWERVLLSEWRRRASPTDPTWWEIMAFSVYPQDIKLAAAVITQLETFYKQDTPNLILYDRFAFAGRILASKLACPAVQIYFNFAYYKRFLYRENGTFVTPEPMLSFSKALDAFFAGHGITGTGNLWHTDKLNIYTIPKEFQYCADCFDEGTCFVGLCLNRRFENTWKKPTDGKAVILISDMYANQDPEYFKMFINALGESEYHVILSIGGGPDAPSLGLLPDNIEISEATSHLAILPHASLLICHGGTGSTLESIYHGVPVIACPSTPDTEEVADRIVELGVGIKLPRKLMSVQTIRDNIRSALRDQAFLGRVSRMQHELRKCGGAKLAADRIEKFLSCEQESHKDVV